MEEIIKAFTGIFFTLLLAFIGISLISASVDARNAQAYMSEAVSEIASSNCATSAVSYYKDHAAEVDPTYEFDVTGKTKSSSSERYYATATLSYDYTIPILGMKKEKVIVSEIR